MLLKLDNRIEVRVVKKEIKERIDEVEPLGLKK